MNGLDNNQGETLSSDQQEPSSDILPEFEAGLENLLDQQALLCPAEDDNEMNSSTQQAQQEAQQPSFKGMLFYRSIYFFDGLSASAWGRFGIIYYNRVKHLNPSQIGILQGVTPVLGFVCQPLWGYVADYIHSRKVVFVVTKACSMLLLLSLSLKFVNNFGTIFSCVAAMACFKSNGVMDAHTLDFLGEAHRSIYGSIRLYSSISWGFGAVIMGFITDDFGFEWNFSLFGGMQTMMLFLIMFGLPSRSKSEQELYDRRNNQQMERLSRPRLVVLEEAICRLPVFCWLLQVAIIGAGMFIVDTFLFVFLQNELQGSTELCGYTVGVTVLLELPIFHYSNWFLKNLGHDALFMLSMLAYSTRVIGYTLLTPETAYWVLALEITHGITFACMWISSIDYAAIVAPKEWNTTVQTLLQSALSCVGGGSGPIIGGWVMNRFGPVIMFRGIGAIVAAVLLVHLVVRFAFGKGHDKFLKEVQAERSSELRQPFLSYGDDDEEVSQPEAPIPEGMGTEY